MFWEKTALFSSSSSPPLVCFWSFPAPLSAALPHTPYKPTHKESSCVQIVSLGKMSTLFKKSIWWGLWSTGPPAISSLFIFPGCWLTELLSKLNQINANRVVKGELLASLFHEIFQRTLKMWTIVIFPNKSQICSHFWHFLPVACLLRGAPHPLFCEPGKQLKVKSRILLFVVRPQPGGGLAPFDKHRCDRILGRSQGLASPEIFLCFSSRFCPQFTTSIYNILPYK